MSIDYKALLEKYMRHVVDMEGFDYVESANSDRKSEVEFTDDELAELTRLSDEIASHESSQSTAAPIPTKFSVLDDGGQLLDLPGVISASSDSKEFTLTILDFRSAGFRLIANKQDGDEIAIKITLPSEEIIDSSGYVTGGEFQDQYGAMSEFIFSYKPAKILAHKK